MPLGKWEPDNRLRAADLIFIILMVMIVLFMFYRGITADSGRYALVYFKNEQILNIDLAKNENFTVRGARCDLRISVNDGKLRILATECREKICMHRGDIFRAGEKIICVPNEIMIRIEGNTQTDTVFEIGSGQYSDHASYIQRKIQTRFYYDSHENSCRITYFRKGHYAYVSHGDGGSIIFISGDVAFLSNEDIFGIWDQHGGWDRS